MPLSYKNSLGLVDETRKDSFKPICNNFGDTLVYSVATSNRPKITT